MRLTGSGRRTGLLRHCIAASAALLLVWQATAPIAPAQTPTAGREPPGSGGVIFDAVRVLSGNNLARNAGQENQPPVWLTIDAKGASAVVTIGNTTRNSLDLNGTVVITLAPSVQPGQVLVSAGSTVVQGNQVVWSGFSLSSGQILPALVNFGAGSPPQAASDGAPAIQQIAIVGKDTQSGSTVSELVAGSGPTVANVASAPTPVQPAGKPAGAVAAVPNSASQSVTPVSRDAARTFAAWTLLLLGCVLVLLLLLATLSLKLGREVRGLRALTVIGGEQAAINGPPANSSNGLQRVESSTSSASARVIAPALAPVDRPQPPEAPRSATGTAMGEPFVAAATDRSARMSGLEVRDGAEQGRTWPIEGPELTIGRNVRNGVVLADPRVSDTHGTVARQDDGRDLFIDKRSTNGTLLNGRLVHEPTELHDGDILRIGGTTFVYHTVLPDTV
jgi:hypothetical protein